MTRARSIGYDTGKRLEEGVNAKVRLVRWSTGIRWYQLEESQPSTINFIELEFTVLSDAVGD